MPRSSAIVLHVEAAKRLLRELEQHADAAMSSLGQENGAEFFAAVDERDRILGQLDAVVSAFTLEHATAGQDDVGETRSLFDEMAQAAAAALESHERLLMRTREERDRLSAALSRNTQTDSIANQYAAASIAGGAHALSVTG